MDRNILKERLGDGDWGSLSSEQIKDLIKNTEVLSNNGFYVAKKRAPQCKFRFVQILQKNWLYLNQVNYLSKAEKSFITDIIPYVDIHSNTIVDDISKKKPAPLSLTQLADELGIELPNLSAKVSKLHKKSIILKYKVKDTGQKLLLVNPNIMYSGKKDDLDFQLAQIFKKEISSNEILKKLPNKLY